MIKVYYTCNGCRAERQIEVRPRRADENAVQWVQLVATCAGFDHEVKSPRCGVRVVDLKIPVEDGYGIGQISDPKTGGG